MGVIWSVRHREGNLGLSVVQKVELGDQSGEDAEIGCLPFEMRERGSRATRAPKGD